MDNIQSIAANLLLNLLIQVTVVVAVATLFALPFRHKPALRHGIWLGALCLVIMLPLANIGIHRSGWSISRTSILSAFESQQSTRASAANTPRTQLPNTFAHVQPFDEQQRGSSFERLERALPTSVSHEQAISSIATSTGRSDGLSIDPLARANAILIPFEFPVIAIGIWMFGIMYFAIRFLGSRRKLSHFLAGCSVSDDHKLNRMFHATWKEIGGGCGNLPRLLLTEENISPFAVGVVQKSVVIPATWIGRTDPACMESIFIHELAHLRRRDPLTVVLQHLVRILFWMHPATFYMNRQLAKAREEVCDNVVLSITPKTSYSRILLRMTGQLEGLIPDGAVVGLFTSQWKLRERIADLLDSRRDCGTRTGLGGRLLILSMISLMSLAVTVVSLPPAKALETSPNTGTTLESADFDDATLAENDRAVFLNTSDPSKDAIGDPLPPRARLRFGTQRLQHPDSVNSMIVSNNDETVVTLCHTDLIVWDSATGKERWRKPWRNYGEHIIGVAYGQRFLTFNQDGSRFYSVGLGNRYICWDSATGEATTQNLEATVNLGQMMRGGLTNYSSIDVSAKEDFVLLGGGVGLGLFDAKTHKRVWFKFNKAKLPPPDGNDRLAFGGHYASGIFGPNSRIVASVSDEDQKRISILDRQNGETLSEIKSRANVVRIAFSRDGKRIFATERDCGIRCYSIDDSSLIWEHKLEADPNGAESYASAIDCSPDGKSVVAGVPIGDKHWIYLLDAASGEKTQIFKGGTWKPWAVKFARDNRSVFSTGWDGAVRRWDVDSGKELPLSEGVRCSGLAALSPDGGWIAVADNAGHIRIVERKSGEEKQRIASDIGPSSLGFSPDSRMLAIGGSSVDQVGVEIWDLSEKKKQHSWYWDKGRDAHSSLEEIHFSPNGQLVAGACFRQNSAYVWSLESNEQVVQITHRSIYGCSFSPDSKILATAGWDKQVRLWSHEKAKVIETAPVGNILDQDADLAQRPDWRMYTVRYSPDGSQLALCHMSGQVSIWDCSDTGKMELVRRVTLPRRFTFGAMEYSPDGLWIAAGSATGNVYLIDALRGNIMLDIPAHESHVLVVGFGRDGRSVMSGGGGLSYLWDLTVKRDTNTQLDLKQLWSNLRALPEKPERSNATIHSKAFDAMQSIALHPQGVEYVASRLGQIENLLVPTNERTEKLMRELAAKSDNAELDSVVHFALMALKISASDEANEALEKLATKHSSEQMRETATKLLGF